MTTKTGCSLEKYNPTPDGDKKLLEKDKILSMFREINAWLPPQCVRYRRQLCGKRSLFLISGAWSSPELKNHRTREHKPIREGLKNVIHMDICAQSSQTQSKGTNAVCSHKRILGVITEATQCKTTASSNKFILQIQLGELLQMDKILVTNRGSGYTRMRLYTRWQRKQTCASAVPVIRQIRTGRWRVFEQGAHSLGAYKIYRRQILTIWTLAVQYFCRIAKPDPDAYMGNRSCPHIQLDKPNL
ncbi:hypothetical protein K470DRAFT_155559 [Piedraia hortae CBS 480.64]|uniref:Uncharacterized protein n=1 Tax=Piedraia hortae CBS 480.64 TaxID=1314780 RepID=A0A6A7C706_9PEZI|nr:hypothetical protein K470DRAFT_155559 [Piedraia hortae CBS 480.64]